MLKEELEHLSVNIRRYRRRIDVFIATVAGLYKTSFAMMTYSRRRGFSGLQDREGKSGQYFCKSLKIFDEKCMATKAQVRNSSLASNESDRQYLFVRRNQLTLRSEGL